jgi:hypothetical protein
MMGIHNIGAKRYFVGLPGKSDLRPELAGGQQKTLEDAVCTLLLSGKF